MSASSASRRRARRARKGPRRPPKPQPRTETKRKDEFLVGQDLTKSPPVAQAEVQVARLQPLPPLRASACVLPQVRPLPALPARRRPSGLHPRVEQVELVTESPRRC